MAPAPLIHSHIKVVSVRRGGMRGVDGGGKEGWRGKGEGGGRGMEG